MSNAAKLRIGIDIGGTFTDFALLDDGALTLHKNLSTPEDRSLGVLQGLTVLAEQRSVTLQALLQNTQAIIHGTTVADNTLIEMNGARTGLLTTHGFRDELELRRGYKEDIWDVRLEPPAPIIPRRRRLGVAERVRANGDVHTPLDEDNARAAIRRLARQNVESVAICTLFSFINPEHELRLAELVAEEMPDAYISLSHQVLPRVPEFERVSTTAVNGYVGPRVSHYIERLGQQTGRGRLSASAAVDAVQWRCNDARLPVRKPGARAGVGPCRRRDRRCCHGCGKKCQ